MSPPSSPGRFKSEKQTDEYLSTYKTQVERIQDLEAEVQKLKSVIEDIENFLDGIPSMVEVYKAVREIQEELSERYWVHKLI